jgi:hypothetical protein
MNTDLEARIRTRAYHIWENDSSPEGNADKHWEEARQQIEAEGAVTRNQADASLDQSADREHGDRLAPDAQLQDLPGSSRRPHVAAPAMARRK